MARDGLGFGFPHKISAAPASITPLTIVTPPVISGGTSIGSTLTVSTPAVWSATPASRIYQWYQDATPISGATGTSYVTVTGDLTHSITVKEQANNGALSTPSQSNAIIVASSGGFATPTLSNFSALGTAPLVLQGSTTDYVAGYRGQLQIATDSGFATITQNWIFFIDGASWASNSVTTGLVTPSGQYWSRWRVLRDNESGTTVTGNHPLNNALSFGADVSPWSNTFTDTISASVAVLTSTNGTSKNSLITISGSPTLTFAGSNGSGTYQGDRATIQAQSALTQMEITINAVHASFSALSVGYDNLTDNMSTNGTAPGRTSNNGIAVGFIASIGEIAAHWNSDANSFVFLSSAGSIAVGDKFTFRLDKTNHTLDVWRTRSGTTTKMGGQATGLPTLTSYYAYVAPQNEEGGTMNFGGSAFAKALDSGYAIYG